MGPTRADMVRYPRAQKGWILKKTAKRESKLGQWESPNNGPAMKRGDNPFAQSEIRGNRLAFLPEFSARKRLISDAINTTDEFNEFPKDFFHVILASSDPSQFLGLTTS